MERSISYAEKDLKNTFNFILSHIENLDWQIRMIEEQSLNLRDNFNWSGVGKFLRTSLEEVKRGLSYFEIKPMELSLSLKMGRYEDHLKQVEMEYFERRSKEIINDE